MKKGYAVPITIGWPCLDRIVEARNTFGLKKNYSSKIEHRYVKWIRKINENIMKTYQKFKTKCI